MRSRVVVVLVTLFVLAIGVGLYRRLGISGAPGAPSRTPASSAGQAGQPSAAASIAAKSGPASATETEYPLAAPLNAPNSTISRDLDTLQQILDAWRSNFPGEGNPVGENSDITAALTGKNRHGLALIPPRHAAINARGELCDRWGTPFRFHQLSGEKMEIRSAGPDRKFATADDAVWTPQ